MNQVMTPVVTIGEGTDFYTSVANARILARPYAHVQSVVGASERTDPIEMHGDLQLGRYSHGDRSSVYDNSLTISALTEEDHENLVGNGLDVENIVRIEFGEKGLADIAIGTARRRELILYAVPEKEAEQNTISQEAA